MSVQIDWKTLTEGDDGQALADTVRDFIHERFQQIPFPRLIRSVTVHSFDFGSIAPEVTLKDISDPLPDFYEDEADDPPSQSQLTPSETEDSTHDLDGHDREQAATDSRRSTPAARHDPRHDHHGTHDTFRPPPSPTLFSRAATPGMLGPNAALSYFQLPLSSRISTRATPLAAVAGAHFPTVASQHLPIPPVSQHRHSESFSSVSSPPPSSTPPSRPTSKDEDGRHASAILDDTDTDTPAARPRLDVGPEDLQVVFHAKYAGDLRLCLTAEVSLDYPMDSFVGIPLKMTVTGMTFDGVGILAYIKRKAHLTFLSPDDADALIGGESQLDALVESEGRLDTDGASPLLPDPSLFTSPSEDKIIPPVRFGALLEDIRIETEMGETDSGKQVLKNVGKIEKFVLAQVQRIFEDEFVYPSFWTFLV